MGEEHAVSDAAGPPALTPRRRESAHHSWDAAASRCRQCRRAPTATTATFFAACRGEGKRGHAVRGNGVVPFSLCLTPLCSVLMV